MVLINLFLDSDIIFKMIFDQVAYYEYNIKLSTTYNKGF